MKFTTGLLITLAVILILASLDAISTELAFRLALATCAYTWFTLAVTMAARILRRDRR